VCNDPNKVLTIMLYDNCDKCTPEQVNLQALPFKQLAPLDIGRVGIQFREVGATAFQHMACMFHRQKRCTRSSDSGRQ
jgi:hypothetical protein